LQKRSEWLVANGIFKKIGTSSSPSVLAVVDKHGDASLQAVAEMAWACATLGFASPVLFDAIDKHSDWIVRHGVRRDVHRIADACRRLGHETPFQLLRSAKKENRSSAVRRATAGCGWSSCNWTAPKEEESKTNHLRPVLFMKKQLWWMVNSKKRTDGVTLLF
jgi:hypothetical protein